MRKNVILVRISIAYMSFVPNRMEQEAHSATPVSCSILAWTTHKTHTLTPAAIDVLMQGGSNLVDPPDIYP